MTRIPEDAFVPVPVEMDSHAGGLSDDQVMRCHAMLAAANSADWGDVDNGRLITRANRIYRWIKNGE